MNELDPGNIANELLDSADEWLWDYVPKDEVVFGGGTILAARWRHRVSTDVDLFCYRDLVRHADRDGLGAELLKRGFKPRMASSHFAAVAENGNKISLFFTNAVTEDPVVPLEEESVRGLRTMSSGEILALKVSGRMEHLGSFVQRDVYDLLTAVKVDPASAKVALESVSKSLLVSAANELKSEPVEFQKKPLMEPAHKAWSGPNALRDLCRTLFEQGIERCAERLNARNEA